MKPVKDFFKWLVELESEYIADSTDYTVLDFNGMKVGVTNGLLVRLVEEAYQDRGVNLDTITDELRIAVQEAQALYIQLRELEEILDA